MCIMTDGMMWIAMINFLTVRLFCFWMEATWRKSSLSCRFEDIIPLPNSAPMGHLRQVQRNGSWRLDRSLIALGNLNENAYTFTITTFIVS